MNLTDLDFADDIALLSDTEIEAQELLRNVENAALCVGLHMNAKKTQVMAFNQPGCVEIQTVQGSLLEEVKDFKYLGSWVKSSEQDIKVRKALAWKSCNKLNTIWNTRAVKHIDCALCGKVVIFGTMLDMTINNIFQICLILWHFQNGRH